jgi:hypothetical protein
MSFTSPTEFQPLLTCPALSCETPPVAFRSPSRHQQEESTCERASQAHPTVRPRRFSRPRRFTPLLALRVCFTPLPRPGFTFQGFSPAAQPERLVVAPFPLAGWRPSPATELPRRLQLRPPRLQGFDPCSDSKPPTRCLVPPTPRSPPRFQLPRAFLRIPWERLHAPSAHDLDRQTLRVNLAAGLQRIDQYPTWYSVPRLPSRPSSPAC